MNATTVSDLLIVLIQLHSPDIGDVESRESILLLLSPLQLMRSQNLHLMFLICQIMDRGPESDHSNYDLDEFGYGLDIIWDDDLVMCRAMVITFAFNNLL